MVSVEASGCGPSPHARTGWAVCLLGLCTAVAAAGVTTLNPMSVSRLAVNSENPSALAHAAAALTVAADESSLLGLVAPGLLADWPTTALPTFVLTSGWGTPAVSPFVGTDAGPGSAWSMVAPTGPGSFSLALRSHDLLDPPRTGDRQVVPLPGAVLLATVGVALVGSLRRRA